MSIKQAEEALRSIKNDPNFSLVEGEQQDPKFLKRVADALDLIEGARSGSPIKKAILQEAMTTADFPNLFGYALSRDVQGYYSEFTADWQAMSRRVDLPDFRNREWYPRNTIDSVLTAHGDDGAPASENRNYSDPTATTWRVSTYSATAELSFRQIVNDDLSFFNAPRDFALAARRTELKVFSQTHWGATGPTGLTAITGNPVLNVSNLKTAVAQMLKTVDANGEPILVNAPILEVGPDLAVTASEIVQATALELTSSSGVTGIRQTRNWVSDFVNRIVVNPYVPIIASSANSATSWCLLASSSSGPAAFEHGWLSGMVGPQVYVKAPNMQRVGGGIDGRLGDFHTLSTEYKVLDIFGCKLVDSKLGFMSNGSGS